MERFLQFLKGYVKISVKGEQTERFLNLCKARGIVIFRISRTGENGLEGILSLHDFFLLAPIRRKTKVHISIKEKHGLPFFFYRNKKRKAFFAGILGAAVIMAVLSCRIWNIHIEGNIINSTPELLAFLKEQGIDHGISKKDVNCSLIASKVRQQYPEITWVSAKIEGTRLILTVQEGVNKDLTAREAKPRSLISQHDGRIVKMITRAGIPQMKPGDTCKKGDLLVLGRLDMTNDSQEVYRTQYVHADADIYIEHDLSYYYEFPLKHSLDTPTGQKKYAGIIKLGSWYARVGSLPRENEKGWRTVTEELPLRLTENFTLPISLGKSVSTQYKAIPSVYTKEEAASLALARIHKFEERLMDKGIQITENNIQTQIKKTTCVSKGTLTVIEKTGMETPVEDLSAEK